MISQARRLAVHGLPRSERTSFPDKQADEKLPGLTRVTRMSRFARPALTRASAAPWMRVGHDRTPEVSTSMAMTRQAPPGWGIPLTLLVRPLTLEIGHDRQRAMSLGDGLLIDPHPVHHSGARRSASA